MRAAQRRWLRRDDARGEGARARLPAGAARAAGGLDGHYPDLTAQPRRRALGRREEEELLALKKVRIERGSTSAELQFEAPEEPGEYTWSVLLVSDSYVGHDQRVEVRIVVQ